MSNMFGWLLFIGGILLVIASLLTAIACDNALRDGRSDGPMGAAVALFIYGFCGVMFGSVAIWGAK